MITEKDEEDMKIAFGMVEGTWDGSDLAKKESPNYKNLNEIKQQWTLTKMIETKEEQPQMYYLKQKEKRRQQTEPKKVRCNLQCFDKSAILTV